MLTINDYIFNFKCADYKQIHMNLGMSGLCSKRKCE